MHAEKLPYEFHITIEAEQAQADRFIAAASELGAKAIVLDLGINNSTDLFDYQTSSTAMLDSDQKAFEEMDRIGDDLSEREFKVVRRKIDSAPWHPDAPQRIGNTMPEGCYFEAHLAILSSPNEVDRLREGIVSATDLVPMHLSRNAFKKADETGRLTMMATLRDYTSPYSKFEEDVNLAKQIVHDLGFSLKKAPITEFALYDSNVHQDNAWMNR